MLNMGIHAAHTHVTLACFLQESQAFDSKWRSRVSEYEASVATQLCALKQQHEAQITELLVRCEGERPQRPQHSSGILNGRKIEEALVKQVCLYQVDGVCAEGGRAWQRQTGNNMTWCCWQCTMSCVRLRHAAILSHTYCRPATGRVPPGP